MPRVPALALATTALLALLTACQSGPKGPPATGQVTPTVAGGAPTATYDGYQAAKEAFTRGSKDGVLIATLEDAAWLRFEGPPDEVEANHRAYFEYGYTAFAVVLRARDFTRPTTETFLLEDNNGARVTARPHSFKGNMTMVDDRWQYEFDLAFRHTITKDTQWIKLTRVSDGEFVEWRLQ